MFQRPLRAGRDTRFLLKGSMETGDGDGAGGGDGDGQLIGVDALV